MRPNLTRDISVEDFLSYYWLKKELQAFCKEHNLSTTGKKEELANRIILYLKTGEVKKSIRKTKKIRSNSVPVSDLSFDTVITENHKCSQSVRGFFKSVVGPKFHFSTALQNYFKSNVGKTYRDVVSFWEEEQERKLDPSYKTEIGSSFEYNQFMRDYYADGANKGKPREQAIAAWKEIKKYPGANKYKPSST